VLLVSRANSQRLQKAIVPFPPIEGGGLFIDLSIPFIAIMMKKFFFATLLTMGIVSCSSEKEQIAVPTLSPDAITLADSTTTVIWLKDNLGDKLMPRNLFPGASDSLMEELSLTGGVPSSISTFLMHADGDWILFDTGLGLDNGGQLVAGLQKLNLTTLSAISFIH